MKMTVRRLDWLLVIPLLATLVMIGETVEIEAGEIVLDPVVQVAGLAGATILIALAVAMATSVDRRCSEDYLTQICASAGLIAVGATALVNMFWGLARMVWPLPDLAGECMAGITIFAWIVSYYWYRLRGLNA